MAIRQATLRYPDLTTFLRDYPSTLAVQALVLPAHVLDGVPAPELKVDLVLPMVGRVGPIVGQVVTVMPDGGVALRITDTPAQVSDAVRRLLALAEEIKQWLLASGQLVVAAAPAPQAASESAEEVARLRARIEQLEAGLEGEGSGRARASAGNSPRRVRGIQVPDVGTPALSGVLADHSLRDAVMRLAIDRQTGLLTLFRADGTRRYGFWSKGGPVAWRTEPIEEQEVLGMLLFGAGSLSKEQLAESLEIMARTDCRQGEAFIEMGVCTFPQLVLMLQKQVDFVLQRALREREGTWTFHPLDALPERFLPPPLRVASTLYRTLLAHTRSLPSQEIAGLLRPWLDHHVAVAPGLERMFDEMKLTPDEQQFVQILQRTSYRLREVFSVSSLSRSQTATAIWCLYQLNLLEMRTESSGVRERERFTRELASRRARSLARTLFDRLDLHWICSAQDVEVAYKRLKSEWGMDLVRTHGEQHRDVLQEINTAMDEAFVVLSSDPRRREYRASMIERGMIDQSAEMLSKKGEMAIMKAASTEALDCFTKALELVPGRLEYQEGLTRARNIPR